MQRVLVTGATGQLGGAVAAYGESLGSHNEVIRLPGSEVVDLADRESVLRSVGQAEPDVIIHCGAWTAVDDCETEPIRAMAVNAFGTRNISEAASLTGAHVCYISTDYVFSGASPDPYNEWDRPDPVSAYGKSKLGGELALDPSSTVIRTSWVCSAKGKSMVGTILRLAANADGPLRFVDDQVGCPSFVTDLAPMVWKLSMGRRRGVHHLTNQGPASWFEFARETVAAAGYDPKIVSPIKTSELIPARPAPRPKNSVMENLALKLSGESLLPDWRETLPKVVAEAIA